MFLQSDMNMFYSHTDSNMVLSENGVPSGKRLHNYGKSHFLMGKLTISMAIFNSYVKLPEGIRYTC
jgi:hypothetical protein